jgi:hypothetical protein
MAVRSASGDVKQRRRVNKPKKTPVRPVVGRLLGLKSRARHALACDSNDAEHHALNEFEEALVSLTADVRRMLRSIQQAGLQGLTPAERFSSIERLQEFLVEKVREFHSRQRLKVQYDPAKTTQQFVQDLLKLASENGKAGAVAQHLVGAKLQLRFPGLTVENRPFSAADEQLGRPGDYIVGSTAFHITVAPMPGVYERCQENLNGGLRVYLLVPEQKVMGARQNAETAAPGRIAVESIESFVSQNIEELSAFSAEQLAVQFRQLLETYNRRVDEAQDDKSLMVDIPPNLQRES